MDYRGNNIGTTVHKCTKKWL